MRTPLPHSRRIALLLPVLCLSFISNVLCQSNVLSYHFRMEPKDTVLHVEVEFKGSKTGQTFLDLPDEWAGQEELFAAVQSISVSGKRAVLSAGDDGSQRLITHAPNAKLTVHYSLKQDRPGALYYPNNFRAVIQPAYFQLTGYSLLVHPAMDPGTIVGVRLDWSGLPVDWKVGNSLHCTSRSYKGKILLGDLENSVFTAGDFRTYETRVKGKPVFVAIRDTGWLFTDSMLIDRINAIITTERTFWNDYSEPYYFVSLIPFAGQGSYNGTSLHQSFMLGMAKDITVNATLDLLLAHEYFHHWNGTQIILKEEIEQENSWFSEGFTDYYCHKLLYEKGILTFDEYLAKVNGFISSYYLSPVRNESKATHGKNYWEGSDYQQIPYKKGFVYALYIDQLIRSASGSKYSLNNVMFDLYSLQKKGKTLSDSTFTELVNHYSGKDIEELQQHYIDTGETIPVVAGSVPNTLLITKDLGVFDLGFDFDASFEARIVTGVVENSEAWKAGLRNGQEIKGASVYFGDSMHPAELYIVENGEEKHIVYAPMSMERTQVPQFEVR